MSIFCLKKLPPATSLGQQLKKRREERNIVLNDIASATHIQKKYLTAIEQGEFRKLPNARTFRLAYIKEYASAVGLDPKICTEQFKREGGLEGTTIIHPHKTIKQLPFTSLSGLFRASIIAGGVLLFGIYLTSQIIRIVRPPHLIVFSPVEGQVIDAVNTTIQGRTEQESSLIINGQNAMVNDKGEFETKIDLINGVNTIVIKAIKKHGKTTTVTRHLVVRLPKKLEQISLKENSNNDKVGL